MMMMTPLLLLALLTLIPSSRSFGWGSISGNYPERVIVRDLPGGKKQTYIINDGGWTFYDSKTWCEDQMKGSLPIIRDDEDINFFMDKVLVAGSPGYSSAAWVGVKPVGGSSISYKWLG